MPKGRPNLDRKAFLARAMEKKLMNSPITQESKEVIQSDKDDRSRFLPEREQERSRDVDVRNRVSIFDEPDYDNLDIAEISGQYQLLAPPARIHPKWGKMFQYWADKNMNNGRRINDMLRQGWIVRDPHTVERGYPFSTDQWNGDAVISVANRHILMEIPEFFWKKLYKKNVLDETERRIKGIKAKHGTMMVDGVDIDDYRMPNAGKFSEDVQVHREVSERKVRIAD